MEFLKRTDTIIAIIILLLFLCVSAFFYLNNNNTNNKLTDNQNNNLKNMENSKNNSKNEEEENEVKDVDLSEMSKAVFETNMGDIEIEFFAEFAPNTVLNFKKLASSGFYDKTKFHRVIPDFMIQGGDPFTKDDSLKARWGTGGPGYTFEDEIYEGNSNNKGTISMANAGPDTNGSQFFINTKDNNFLDGKHTVFGKVISGMDIVEKIESVQTGERDIPVESIIIESIELK